MDFIYDLYQNDNFVLYLTIALVILIILFVVVFFFGKKDQKLEETKKLQKIEMDAFKEEKTEPVKVELNQEEADVKENVKEETEEKPVKSIFDETRTIPLVKEEKEDIKPIAEPQNVDVTTFEPEATKQEEKPLFMTDEQDLFGNDEEDIGKELSELAKLKQEFKSLDVEKEEKPLLVEEDTIPSRLDRKKEIVEKPVIKEEKREEKKFKPGPQIFSSVFVNNNEEKKEDIKQEEKTEIKSENKKVSLFTIEDEEELELPTLKKEEKKESVNLDNITGETYNINR